MSRYLLPALCLLLLSACAPPTQDAAQSSAAQSSNAGETAFPVLTGPYLGQQPPGAEAKIFAPGIVSTGLTERDLVVSPDGNEIFWVAAAGNMDYAAIFSTRLVDGAWTKPEALPFASDATFPSIEPAISSDGNRFFFVSERPRDGGTEAADYDIWYVDRGADGWGEPANLGPPVNTDDAEYFPSLTNDGTIYFTRDDSNLGEELVFRARPDGNGGYLDPEPLPEQVNTGNARYNAHVARDESFIIVPVAGRDDSLGATDYYVSFRNSDDSWSEAVHLGDQVSSKSRLEYSPTLSPDGRYLFFMTSRPAHQGTLSFDRLQEIQKEHGNGLSDIYWIDASFISDLRP